jgi:lipoprotein-anchoring transpeptidase ErfK/SrfK
MRGTLIAPLLAGVGAALVAPQARAGNLGGGFIEFLVTGSSGPARVGPPQYAAPAPQERSAEPYVIPAPVPTQGPLPTRVSAMPAPSAAVVAPEPSAVHREIDPKYRRQEVAYTGREGAGTIVVDTPNRFLYFVLGEGRAIRYGIGVGRPGFEWSGVKTITRKAEWPDWTPPAEMLLRRPELPKHMAGGPENPLGARAMYLGSTLYRLHGTNEPWTIGQNVSSGCIRLMNEDVIDLYEHAKVGTKVVII